MAKKNNKNNQTAAEKIQLQNQIVDDVIGKVTSGYASVDSKTSDQTQSEDKELSAKLKQSLDSLSSIKTGIKNISENLFKLEKVFKEALEQKKSFEYLKEEAAMEELPEKPGLAATGKEEDNKGFFELIKDFFTNPAVVAAFSSIVYLFLPKDIKEKIGSFFKGFSDGLGSTNEPLSTFQKALISTGAGLTTYLGASLLKSVADSITTVISLISKAKTSFGKLKGKGAVKSILKSASKNKAAIAGVAVGGATFAGLSMQDSSTSSEPAPASTGGSAAGTGAVPDTKPPVAGSAPPTSAPGSADDPMNADLSKYVVKKDASVDLEGLDPNLKKRLAGMAKEYHDKTGKKIQINSAYRDSKKQAELFARIGRPNAAPPGRSKHEFGVAFDMNSSDAATAIQLGLFQKYGFTRPIPAETWHVEPLEARGGSFPDNPITPGAPVVVASAQGAVVPGTGEKVPQSITKPKVAATATSTELSQLPALKDDTDQAAELVASQQEADSTPDAEPISSAPSTGMDLAKSSESVEQGYEGGSGGVINNTVDNSQAISEKQGPNAPGEIPSPIANRGSLSFGVKHASAY